MKYFVLLVLQDICLLDEIINSWKESGATGITVFPSMGMSHLSRRAALRDDLPMMPAIDDLIEHEADSNHTLFTIVPDEAMADRIIEVTQLITGNLDRPNTGIITAWPVTKVVGLNPPVDEN